MHDLKKCIKETVNLIYGFKYFKNYFHLTAYPLQKDLISHHSLSTRSNSSFPPSFFPSSSNTNIMIEEKLEKLDIKNDNPALSEPFYIKHRIAMFDRLKVQYDDWKKVQNRLAIKVTMADGRELDGISWETTPWELAKQMDPSWQDRLVIAKVDGILWDTTRPLENSCTLELLDFEDSEGKAVFWHSSAHILGEACEGHYSCNLCLGPPIDDGFYYEMSMPESGRVVTDSDYPALNKLSEGIIKARQPFERLEMSKEDLLEMFYYNPLKIHLIKDKIPDGTKTTVYRCGPLIDLCKGPHVPHTGRIKTMTVTKHSSSYFLGKAENEVLQRVYGISFPEKEQMKEWRKFIEEAATKDHRRIGQNQQLFFFHEYSPGSCFFLPHGVRIYNRLTEYLRSEYRKRGFSEVMTPNIFNSALWKTSGHWENYQENMFLFNLDKEAFALKPMNCPSHCLMFAHRDRSYKELPIRFADFGVLHRNELSGALHGLTRVRKFQQDDAHIFCRPDQIEQELAGCLDFLTDVYKIMGFKVFPKLSTRPEKYLGELELWNRAEAQLKASLDASGHKWDLNEGDGAFYGPKIDIYIQDALKRIHQCGTIQLDFQLPIRFDLSYRRPVEDGQNQNKDQQEAMNTIQEIPVIIHRAIIGSVERFLAILTENYGGDWPFWLSPRQLVVIPISHNFDDYARDVNDKLHAAGFYVDVDLSDITFNKKIRNAEIAKYNHVLVVGGKEQEEGTVNIRKANKEGKDILLKLERAIEVFRHLEVSKDRNNFIEI